MLIFKGIKLRIYPNEEQKDLMVYNFGANRFVWNQMLDMLKQRYENNPDSKFLNAFALNNLLKQLKIEYPWLSKSDSHGLQNTNKDLIDAYKHFFKHISSYPKFKSRKFPKQSYKTSYVNNNIEVVGNFIKIPKLGYIYFKGSNKAISKILKIKSATIKKSSTNKFYAVLLVESENQVFNKTDKVVGLDMGIADLVITSDGIKYPTIRFDKLLDYPKHKWEKKLARRRIRALKDIQYQKKYSILEHKSLEDYKNYQKAKVMVAKYNEKAKNQRNDYINKITNQIVKNYDVIVIENLKSSNMIKNHKLARAIANSSWREIRRQLEYKCSWYGKKLVIVNPFKTSQICSNCGYDDGKHTLDIREWTCPNCHKTLDRDINASKNILNKGLEQALVK